MSSATVRKLTFSPLMRGFWDGFARGMASSDDVFETPLVRLRGGVKTNLTSDRDALRKDVERAKEKFSSSFRSKQK